MATYQLIIVICTIIGTCIVIAKYITSSLKNYIELAVSQHKTNGHDNLYYDKECIDNKFAHLREQQSELAIKIAEIKTLILNKQ